jgi:hypothetical protein
VSKWASRERNQPEADTENVLPPFRRPPKEFFGISSFRGKLRQARSWKIFGIL